ncbi:tRNA pseudouridine synthase B, interruption-N [Methylococcus capsulatus str. Bath]|uniref:tRNA pseudouridine synthase B n=1 Tax=Methylococcus capsulatus (strain ATCC 33009 / NCIMB 11132 / Bath) TaxID=243233 RepID=TRUB_METCA|nr:tRNA pseudouridine(55) synthase TruB [Methylococcus capsulatus]Q609C2.1 RecName: Full=tRNA pseudouridine synthase B; AltName: Full=tRNA pseudouridine(55) synthase; Short=Psi55 synthase; AltName: Full=tRNA pseudouridylate synthase; AltName: Full=tRNA-uridine isomerase [Methylococcus capsulatus str. Bath]AAU92658.1 tRNA pseudouridine synthase B, interruption-N [Methylococcus capsulatus str. Bath]
MGAISTATLSGVLLLDKGSGMTSNSALQRARKLLDMRKAGHTGSLDPLASGILPLCFNEATKLSSYLLDSDKRYRVLARLGVTTDTGDADGEVRLRTPVPALDEPALLTVLAGFTGPILQVPPMFSALKHRGKRLYELARKGVEVERPPRPVTVFEIELAGRGADYLELDVHCSKGTYQAVEKVSIEAAMYPFAWVRGRRKPFFSAPTAAWAPPLGAARPFWAH